MRIRDVDIPADLEIPELDPETIARIDAVHELMLADREESRRFSREAETLDFQPLTEEQAWRRYRPGEQYRPRAHPTPSGLNVEALRRLPPHVRAIVAYMLNRPRQDATGDAV